MRVPTSAHQGNCCICMRVDRSVFWLQELLSGQRHLKAVKRTHTRNLQAYTRHETERYRLVGFHHPNRRAGWKRFRVRVFVCVYV
jgi:hypothetical protein